MNIRRNIVAPVLLGIVGLAALAPPEPQAEDDPDERAAQRLQLQRTVRENCVICHSDDLITSQRLTPKQWKAEVEKMVGWGSPLPSDQRTAVIEFLSTEYPASLAVTAPTRLRFDAVDQPSTNLSTPGRSDAERGESLFVKHCANCHAPDGQGGDLGPNLVEKPILWNHRGATELIQKGQGRMPAFTGLIDRDAENDILGWLRSRRYRPNLPTSR